MRARASFLLTGALARMRALRVRCGWTSTVVTASLIELLLKPSAHWLDFRDPTSSHLNVSLSQVQVFMFIGRWNKTLSLQPGSRWPNSSVAYVMSTHYAPITSVLVTLRRSYVLRIHTTANTVARGSCYATTELRTDQEANPWRR
jgi:hypothetical protein